MKASDFYYYEAIVKNIVRKEIKPEFCKYCHPACVEYEFKLFGKTIHVDFLSGGKLVDIHGRGYGEPFNVVLDIEKIEFYRTHKRLLVH